MSKQSGATTAADTRLGAEADELTAEQAYVDALYGRLDEVRAQAARRVAEALRSPGGTPQERSQRESAVWMYTDQVQRYDAVENGLCFGRLDITDGTRRYIGRIGLLDEEATEPLLIDWRAPAARPFYLATAANPQEVTRRRHLRTRDRRVVGLNDEVLDLGSAEPSTHPGLVGEAPLLAALGADRTGRMSDIVETIQAEQDEVIRADLGGVLVVQGGPGTGKTAVALHRAAYLLYHHRRELASRGVLLVGPNETFLRYISDVLPALAETGVLLRTPATLFPGVVAGRAETAEAAGIKGRARMVEVLAAAVRDRQELPAQTLEIEVDSDTLRLDRETVRTARDVARRTGKPHNLARERFDLEVVHALAGQVAERIGADPLGGENLLEEADLAEIRRELRAEPAVRAALDLLWPELTPQRLLADLYASPDRIAVAAEGVLTAPEQALLHRTGDGWSPADVPLLDEAAELLGERRRDDRARQEELRRRRLEYAQGVLDIAVGSRSIDVEDEADGGEILSVADLLDSERILDRQDRREQLTTAERAAADRGWAFGHVIVDEAQELSPMAWRLLMRRCPSRSMTIVGDVAQTGALAGTAGWHEVLEPYVDQRWRLAELTVSYRTPAEVMAVAARVLAEIDPRLEPPSSVRSTGKQPWDRRVPAARFTAAAVEAVAQEAAAVGDGRLGVVVPASRVDELGAAIGRRLPEAALGADPELRRRLVVLTVAQAKGLEFDTVLVLDPERIVADSPRGLNDLYVALTRATQRLGVLRTGSAP